MIRIAVNQSQRYAKMRAHTATHLLHAALGKIIRQTKQEWSLVDEDYLRFDFSTKDALSHEQIRQIEDEVNDAIIQALPVSIQEMSLKDAKQRSAKMFFGDKYGNVVRVVSIGYTTDKGGSKEGGSISVELCGGTHVTNTREIGAFIITWQESVASGIKRLTAYTGPKVARYMQEKQSLIDSIRGEVSVAGESQLLSKIQKILAEQKEQASIIESLKAKLVGGVLQTIELTPKGVFDGMIAIDDYPDLQGIRIKNIATEARTIFVDKTIILYDKEWTFALLALGDVSAKAIAKDLWLRGGWSDELVQGRESDIEEKILW